MLFKLSFKNIGIFAFIWLNIGFALGFTFLIGPVRWAATYSRENNFSDSTESRLVKVVILLFVIVSFIISMLLATGTIKAKAKVTRILIPVICLALGSAALYQLLHPQNLKGLTRQARDTEFKQFTFGSYPTLEELKSFKEEGYTSVISLLHPAVTPFEPVLLKEEEDNCRKAGLTLISVPMLPWVSENKDALDRIRQFAEHPQGKYYVHCYLGKDRVNLVKRLISTYNKSFVVEAPETKGRSLEGISQFERGAITKISQDVYYIPYPTDEEYSGYIIGGGVQQVVSLMDPTDPEQKTRIDEETGFLRTYRIPFENIPLGSTKNKKELDKLKEKISKMPKPLVIHRFFSNTADDLAIIDELKK